MIKGSFQLSLGIFLLTFGLLAGCGNPSPSQPEENATEPVPSSEVSAETSDHNCEISGKTLENNQLWLREAALLLCIVADSATYDPKFGDGHRILEVYDTKSCQRIDRKILPVSHSPDFPYSLAEVSYNHLNKRVAAYSFDQIFIYDTDSRSLSSEVQPVYKNERYGEDAQSGMIIRLELWENYLVGFAEDYGAFAFSLNKGEDPMPLLPNAEYKMSEEAYHQLFLLPAGDGKSQILLPAYDYDSGQFSINPVFEDPLPLNAKMPSNVSDNRFLIIRTQDDARLPIAIDMAKQIRVLLPADVEKESTQKILDWLRQQDQIG